MANLPFYTPCHIVWRKREKGMIKKKRNKKYQYEVVMSGIFFGLRRKWCQPIIIELIGKTKTKKTKIVTFVKNPLLIFFIFYFSLNPPNF